MRPVGRGLTQRPVRPGRLRGGFVCLCEDVTVRDLEDAWAEGFRSTELLKRYTTATMGPCQGALCDAHLREFVRERVADEAVSAPTTARPPARPIRLEDAAAGHAPIEQRTALHERHLELGAEMEWAGHVEAPADVRRSPCRVLGRSASRRRHGRRHARQVPGGRARRSRVPRAPLPLQGRRPRGGEAPLRAAPQRGGLRDRRRNDLPARSRALVSHLHDRRGRPGRSVVARLGGDVGPRGLDRQRHACPRRGQRHRPEGPRAPGAALGGPPDKRRVSIPQLPPRSRRRYPV